MINLNRLKNYSKISDGVGVFGQFDKVEEEFEELDDEIHKFDTATVLKVSYTELEEQKDKMKAEALDLITATYNLLVKLDVEKIDIDKHCEKMASYLAKGGKYNP